MWTEDGAFCRSCGEVAIDLAVERSASEWLALAAEIFPRLYGDKKEA